MKRFFYFSAGVLCLSVSALIGFYLGSKPARAQLPRQVVGVAVDGAGSSVFVLEADGDLWSRRIEYVDVIDGYGTYVPSLTVSPRARYMGNFFDRNNMTSTPGAIYTK